MLDKRRIAVLPFQNMSPDPGDEYFADGMTEELISTMSKIRHFEVISRTTVMQFKKNPKSISEVSEALDAGSILEGSVRKSGNKVRITVQLIDPAKDRDLWTESYDRELKDVFSIQSEISRAVADELKVRVAPKEETMLAKEPTSDTEAYTLYLKGRYQLNRRTREGIQNAIQYFTQSAQKDSGFAPAYSGLADCYVIQENWGFVPPPEAEARIKTYVTKALELDDSSSEAHVALAAILSTEWNIDGAEREIKRAIDLNPNNATAHQRYAFAILGPTGRVDEAIREFREAIRLDPLSPIIAANLGDEYLTTGNYKMAEEQYRRVLAQAPNFSYAHSRLGLALAKQSCHQEAIDEIQHAVKLSEEDNTHLVDLVYAYSSGGQREDALRTLRELEERSTRGYVSNVQLALANAAAGRNEIAFEFLDKAAAEKSNQIRSNMLEPHFDEMRSDPRFQKLVKMVGIRRTVPK